MTEASPREILIGCVERLLAGCRHIAVGASSPIPAAGAMLLRARREREGAEPVRLSILGSVEHNVFTNGGVELFDCAAQGRIDAFFLGGGQIDGHGNINLVGTGRYPETDVRWPGSFGSSFMAAIVPRVILFREEHSPRVFVERVDFVSATGTSDSGIHRTGGPTALLTSRAQFAFADGRFRLESLHPGHSLDEVVEATGFAFAHDARPATTTVPDAETLALLRGPVLDDLAETYPDFARKLRRELHPAAA